MIVATCLLRRNAHFDPALPRLRDAVALILIGGFGAAVISATIGATTLRLSGAIPSEDLLLAWAVWWTGDAMGVLAVAPFLLCVPLFWELGPWPAIRWLEEAAILVVVDEPKTSPYGGVVAAPAFSEIARSSLAELEIAPDDLEIEDGVVRAVGAPDRAIPVEELAAKARGYEAAEHQAFVGAGYFDEVAQVIAGGTCSTLAMEGSTEREQFQEAGQPRRRGPSTVHRPARSVAAAEIPGG